MRATRLLAIDLDGTLVDSAPDLASCVDRALEAAGFAPPGLDKVRAWVGDGIETLLHRALEDRGARPADEDVFRLVLDRFSGCYRQRLFVDSTLYPGVAETLELLQSAGIRLACVTNKRIAFADALLVQAGIRRHFDLVLGGDSLPEKKPSPMPLLAVAERLRIDPAQAAMVGDSHHDYRAAAGAGFAFIWASYGYCPQIDATSGAPLTRIERFGELGAYANS